jgi:hypothetical protein
MSKLKALWTLVTSQLADLWNRSKVFLLAIAALILTLEWEKIKETVLVYLGQKEIKSDQKQDATLAATEKKDSDAADALVQQAQLLPTQQKPIADDWNQK